MTRRPSGTALVAAARARPALADLAEPPEVVAPCQDPELALAARETSEPVSVKRDTP
jgi:hypothetical protein